MVLLSSRKLLEGGDRSQYASSTYSSASGAVVFIVVLAILFCLLRRRHLLQAQQMREAQAQAAQAYAAGPWPPQAQHGYEYPGSAPVAGIPVAPQPYPAAMVPIGWEATR
ncbi:hypothetical protein WJX72_006582 [[Myrmecia] bisecta]|uniref:Uncharacterized protein n=1 Tax=[Myrmecia] bisecta TaxID=41462 RepID=A0AAW1PXG8_9CHLO